jgi:hypothetical protein
LLCRQLGRFLRLGHDDLACCLGIGDDGIVISTRPTQDGIRLGLCRLLATGKLGVEASEFLLPIGEGGSL